MLEPYLEKNKVEVGIDEAGRGCLAGPVVAAAVILPKAFDLPGLKDSKKISLKNRLRLEEKIKKQALAWSVGEASAQEIDKINVLQATFLAMHRAVEKIDFQFDQLLIDGNHFKPYKNTPHHCIIKGDDKIASIAAASILAKTYRDKLMKSLAITHSDYGWDHNVGYPTLEHRKAIERNGITEWHRRSFKMLADK